MPLPPSGIVPLTDRRSAAGPVRRVAVVTVGRSDFAIVRPLCRLLAADPGFDCGLWVGGAHFDAAAGLSLDEVRASGLAIWAEIAPPDQPRTAAGTVLVMADQLAGFGRVIGAGPRPDLVIILGDRYEAIAAGLATVPFNLPVAHVSGGSVTEGAIDDVFRHCLTKIAALHFCEIPQFARRIRQMGEAPDRIHTVGALGLDTIRAGTDVTFAALRDRFGLPATLGPGYALATLHPGTRHPEAAGAMAEAMIAALMSAGLTVIHTHPNADPGADRIVAAIEAAVAQDRRHHIVPNFGADWFRVAMAHAGLVIGNSSSGIIEAASFALPVIDIGDRQKGRFHGANVLHAAAEAGDIGRAIAAARTPAMAARLAGLVNPYGDGQAARRILSVLARLDWGALGGAKPFCAPDPGFDGAWSEPA